MSWQQLVDIIREGSDYAREEAVSPPEACPNDGEPLEAGPRGELHCTFDGYVWPEVFSTGL